MTRGLVQTGAGSTPAAPTKRCPSCKSNGIDDHNGNAAKKDWWSGVVKCPLCGHEADWTMFTVFA
jgi:endogenous inhibitor of DNA gyrase (YacG/DUF329 family)